MHLLLLSLALFIPAMSAKPAYMEHKSTNFPLKGESWKVDVSQWPEVNETAHFDSSEEMLSLIQSKMGNDDVMIKIDPEKMQELNGTYVEVLSSQPLSCASVSMSCHSYNVEKVFCHAPCSQYSSYAYNVMRETKNGNVFPAVFSRHYVCKKKEEGRDCFWQTQMDELVVFPKLLI